MWRRHSCLRVLATFQSPVQTRAASGLKARDNTAQGNRHAALRFKFKNNHRPEGARQVFIRMESIQILQSVRNFNTCTSLRNTSSMTLPLNRTDNGAR